MTRRDGLFAVASSFARSSAACRRRAPSAGEAGSHLDYWRCGGRGRAGGCSAGTGGQGSASSRSDDRVVVQRHFAGRAVTCQPANSRPVTVVPVAPTKVMSAEAKIVPTNVVAEFSVAELPTVQ